MLKTSITIMFCLLAALASAERLEDAPDPLKDLTDSYIAVAEHTAATRELYIRVLQSEEGLAWVSASKQLEKSALAYTASVKAATEFCAASGMDLDRPARQCVERKAEAEDKE